MITRSTLLRATAALVGIVSIAVVASTLPEVLETTNGGGGVDGPDGSTDGSAGDRAPSDPGAAWILRLFLISFMVILIGATIAFLLFERRHLLEYAARLAALSLLILAFVVVAVVAMDVADLTPPMENESAGEEGLGPGEGGDDEGPGDGESGDSTTFGTMEILLVGIALLAAVALGYLYVRYRSDEEASTAGDIDRSTTETVRAVAGDAADRIEGGEGAPVENEVYRAWREMTTLLDVDNPATSTPGEFADAAVDAGLDTADVRELTELFESVRYGPARASSMEERRAVEILRNIESAYSAVTESESAAASTRTGQPVTSTQMDHDTRTASDETAGSNNDTERRGDGA
ncbi:DUF4129 domain-containing protein [Halovivax gelatinilyticus]|uniref:DUF4129 domain-containing protein n=1 Tax=Halovivax gelatinilyticus TaxID=2961597 RepID=UPI0020CA429A|nr:DUF4129 domain-containing protein [Halovivax gelatinilyticus]